MKVKVEKLYVFTRTLQLLLNNNVTDVAAAQRCRVLSAASPQLSKLVEILRVMTACSQSRSTVCTQTDEEIQAHKKSGA